LAEFVSRRGARIETTRKLIHILSASIALPFFGIYTTHWSVLVLGVVFTTALLMAKLFAPLRSLQQVGRASLGELFLPIGIYATFCYVAWTGVRWTYVPAICVLAYGDSLAAILGQRFGTSHYRVAAERKSFPGATVIAAVTIAVCLGMHVPLGYSEIFLLASFLMLIEAVSVNGLDNLLLPVSTVALGIGLATPQTNASITLHGLLAALSILLTFIASWRKLDIRVFAVIMLLAIAISAHANPILFALIALAAISSLPSVTRIVRLEFSGKHV